MSDEIKRGIPEDTGLLLFNIFVNDLLLVIEEVMTILCFLVERISKQCSRIWNMMLVNISTGFKSIL